MLPESVGRRRGDDHESNTFWQVTTFENTSLISLPFIA
jgi:hypothetical protein